MITKLLESIDVIKLRRNIELDLEEVKSLFVIDRKVFSVVAVFDDGKFMNVGMYHESNIILGNKSLVIRSKGSLIQLTVIGKTQDDVNKILLNLQDNYPVVAQIAKAA